MRSTIDTSFDSAVELDERESNGIRVTLLWIPSTNRAFVLVYDARSRESFHIPVRRTDNPLDVFYHPFAYHGDSSDKSLSGVAG